DGDLPPVYTTFGDQGAGDQHGRARYHEPEIDPPPRPRSVCLHLGPRSWVVGSVTGWFFRQFFTRHRPYISELVGPLLAYHRRLAQRSCPIADEEDVRIATGMMNRFVVAVVASAFSLVSALMVSAGSAPT